MIFKYFYKFLFYEFKLRRCEKPNPLNFKPEFFSLLLYSRRILNYNIYQSLNNFKHYGFESYQEV